MLSIGNKKYRNLQEQVGFNTEQIEKIFDVLDGLAVTDNVVAIADLSDNLNTDQLEIVQKSVAFLVYDGQLYIKKSEDASKAYFDIVFTISSSGGVISFNSKEIEVDLATGALSQTISTNSTYSSSQIDTMVGAKADKTYVDTQLALKANLAGANFTGAITAPSIIENMSGYSFTKYNTLNWQAIYVGVCKNGNKLSVCIFGKYTYATGDGTSTLGRFIIPAEVDTKLIPYVVDGQATFDQKVVSFYNGRTLFTSQKMECVKVEANSFDIKIVIPSGMTDGTDYIFRYEITFLLSENLAS